jgi:hypothetical protein
VAFVVAAAGGAIICRRPHNKTDNANYKHDDQQRPWPRTRHLPAGSSGEDWSPEL